jgi:hypothetical protein
MSNKFQIRGHWAGDANNPASFRDNAGRSEETMQRVRLELGKATADSAPPFHGWPLDEAIEDRGGDHYCRKIQWKNGDQSEVATKQMHEGEQDCTVQEVHAVRQLTQKANRTQQEHTATRL